MIKNQPLLIYNLFPRVFPNINSWCKHVPFVKSMDFNWIYVNPFNETCTSRSLYAIKSHYKLNPEFLNGTDPSDFSPVKEFTSVCKKAGITVIIDLVINHASNESDLVREHPNWFKWCNGNLVHPSAIDPSDASIVTVWGDLVISICGLQKLSFLPDILFSNTKIENK
jgi:starch synthase (maltosyl-transferring)